MGSVHRVLSEDQAGDLLSRSLPVEEFAERLRGVGVGVERRPERPDVVILSANGRCSVVRGTGRGVPMSPSEMRHCLKHLDLLS